MKKSRQSAKAARIVREAVVQLFALKLGAGDSPEALKQFSDDCVEIASRNLAFGQKRSPKTDYHRIGSMLRAWHRETRYLSKDGYPRPLRVAGSRGLEQLARRFSSKRGVDDLIAGLKRGRLIRQDRSGRWIPNGKQVVVPYISQAMFEHIAEGVARFVETVTRNITNEAREPSIFERSAKVHRFPVARLPAFHEFVRAQASVFLGAVDDWMELEAEEADNKRSKKCAVGVFTFAFADTKARKPSKK